MTTRPYYLLLSALTGFLELGAVLFGIRQGWSPTVIFLMVLGYQAGSAVLNVRHDFRWRHFQIAVCAALILAVFLPSTGYILVLILLLLSVGLQGLRAEALRIHPVGTAAKRSSRIIGFVFGGLFEPSTLIAASTVSFVTGLLLRRSDSDVHRHHLKPEAPRQLGLSGVAMVIHQMHYFSYAYALPILFIRDHGLADVLAGLTFSLGWVSYTSTPLLLGQLPTLPVVVGGHIAVAALLFSLGSGHHGMTWLAGAWFLTGFGGGTVFCIRRLAAAWAPGDRTTDMDAWENVGHVLGVVVSLGIVSAGFGLSALFHIAGFFALATAVILGIGGARYHLRYPSQPVTAKGHVR